MVHQFPCDPQRFDFYDAPQFEVGDGWDLTGGFVEYSPCDRDGSLTIRLECRGICGDADEDGNPDHETNFDLATHDDEFQLAGTEHLFCFVDSLKSNNNSPSEEWAWYSGVLASSSGAAGKFVIGEGKYLDNSDVLGQAVQGAFISEYHFPTQTEGWIEWTISGLDNTSDDFLDSSASADEGFRLFCQAGSNADETGEDAMLTPVIPLPCETTKRPTLSPTPYPSQAPTPHPTPYPSPAPTPHPSTSPTLFPTRGPTTAPTPYPTHSPTAAPTRFPTPAPTEGPTAAPTSNSPTPYPTRQPTRYPTRFPTPSPTRHPVPSPTPSPTASPTVSPTQAPTTSPTPAPTRPTCWQDGGDFECVEIVDGPDPANDDPTGGWDLQRGEFCYNRFTDVMTFKIHCRGACGDADGDGNPDSAPLGAFTQPTQGDWHHLSRSEHIYCFVGKGVGTDPQFDLARTYDWWSGVPTSVNAIDDNVGYFRVGVGGYSSLNYVTDGSTTITGEWPMAGGRQFIKWQVRGVSKMPNWDGQGFHILCKSGTTDDESGEDDMGKFLQLPCPTPAPTPYPTRVPTLTPSRHPTRRPTVIPTRSPSRSPTRFPTNFPTPAPTPSPTTAAPTPAPVPICDPSRLDNDQIWKSEFEDPQEDHNVGMGWDLQRATFFLNPNLDQLTIKLTCLGVCGDADGDEDPNAASPGNFLEASHQDHVDLGGSERIFCRIGESDEGLESRYHWWTGVVNSDNAIDQGAGAFHNGVGPFIPKNGINSEGHPGFPGLANAHFPTVAEPWISWTVTELSLAPGWDASKALYVLCQAGSNVDATGEDDIRGEIECSDDNIETLSQDICAGNCDSLNSFDDLVTQEVCYCDPSCKTYNDCCTNYLYACEGMVDTDTCEESCTDTAPHTVVGSTELCYCDATCKTYNDCCDTYDAYCSQAGAHQCTGNCDNQSAFFDSSSGTACYCDDMCNTYNDCCPGRSDEC